MLFRGSEVFFTFCKSISPSDTECVLVNGLSFNPQCGLNHRRPGLMTQLLQYIRTWNTDLVVLLIRILELIECSRDQEGEHITHQALLAPFTSRRIGLLFSQTTDVKRNTI